MFQLHSSLRERSGQRQPPAGRSPVLSLEHTEYHQVLLEVPGTRYRYVCVCTCLFASVIDFALHLGPLQDFFFANYTRTAGQILTSPTNTAQAAQTGQSTPHK